MSFGLEVWIRFGHSSRFSEEGIHKTLLDPGFRISDMGYGIWDMGYGIWDMEFGIWDLGSGIWDLG